MNDMSIEALKSSDIPLGPCKINNMVVYTPRDQKKK